MDDIMTPCVRRLSSWYIRSCCQGLSMIPLLEISLEMPLFDYDGSMPDGQSNVPDDSRVTTVVLAPS